MTSILNPYACWPVPNLMDRNDCSLPMRHDVVAAEATTASPSVSSSTSTSPRSPEQADMCLPNDLGVAYSLHNDMLNYQSAVSPAQLYALNQNFLQQQLMLRQLTNPVHPAAPHQPLTFMTDYAAVAGQAVPMLQMANASQNNLRTSSASALVDSMDSAEPLRRTKRRRGDRLSGSSEFKMDGEESDSESGMERYKATKQAKSSADSVPEGDLSDITPLLSLPQKEAAQRLGISESMLCKRFKECTRRKWPFRFLRKIEKTIASLESQKDVEPLSSEDQDRLEELLRQRIECLAPVKIRITKSPSPVPCSRSSLADSDSTHHDAEDSDSDDSDTRELDYESEAIENLIHLSRATTPRSLFAVPTQLAC